MFLMHCVQITYSTHVPEYIEAEVSREGIEVQQAEGRAGTEPSSAYMMESHP